MGMASPASADTLELWEGGTVAVDFNQGDGQQTQLNNHNVTSVHWSG
ncbi:hypothetical protein ACFQ61_15970 [Streptomyces sp. NPDC056500]